MTDKKPCEVDNKIVFDKETDYTEYCSVCQHFVKLYKYRSCEYQHEELQKLGQDPFQSVRAIEKASQLGAPSSLPKNPNEKSVPKKPTRRGR